MGSMTPAESQGNRVASQSPDYCYISLPESIAVLRLYPSG